MRQASTRRPISQTGRKRLLALTSLVAILCAGCERWNESSEARRAANSEPLNLAISSYVGVALIHVAVANRYFEKEGLRVTLQPHSAGRAALDAVLSGRADLATVAELPVTLSALQGQPVVILATLASGGGDYAVVGRKNSGIDSASSLTGKRIGVTSGTSGDFFLDAFLVRHRLARSDVHVTNRKPEEMADALAAGELDAVSTWEPYISIVRKRLGENAVVLSSTGIYESSFNLAASQDFLRARGDSVSRLLRALLHAEQAYQRERASAESIIADALGRPLDETKQILSRHRLGLSLDQGLLVMMEDEARWAIRNQIVASQAIPNFLPNIHLDGLLAVKPRSVTVIH